MVKFLLIEGNKADASHKTNDGSTALHIAASLGNRKLVRLLSPHLDLTAGELDDLDSMVPDDVKAKFGFVSVPSVPSSSVSARRGFRSAAGACLPVIVGVIASAVTGGLATSKSAGGRSSRCMIERITCARTGCALRIGVLLREVCRRKSISLLRNQRHI